jgi:hypothetical protein
MPNKVKFDIECYNDTHKTELRKLSIVNTLDDALANGLEIDDQEYLVYTLFREQKAHPAWHTYAQLKAKLPSRQAAYEDYFDLSGGTVRSKFINAADLDNTKTESSGVGATLSVVSSLYGMTEADWEKIPVAQTKDLDFQASTGTEMVEVEAKGTVDDSRALAGISGKKGDIEAKKSTQRSPAVNNTNTLIGVIASFPNVAGQNAICRVLDPPVESPTNDPRKYKLLARLSYYLREIRIVSRPHLLIALANRLQAISLVEDYSVFDNKPLLNQYGEQFYVPGSPLWSHSVVGNNYAFGEVVPLEFGMFYFYGFETTILDMLIEQSFDRILNYHSPRAGERLRAQILARVPDTDFPQTKASIQEVRPPRVENAQRFQIRSESEFAVTRAGRVIGKVVL